LPLGSNREEIKMNTIYLEPNMVPATLRAGYDGKKFKAVVATEMTIPADAGLWEGGSRETYRVIGLETGRTIDAVNHNAAPWDSGRKGIAVKLEPGIAVVCHSMFCGKDMGLTFYVHPDNAAKLLPAPVEVTPHERVVLRATAHFKSSYAGQDRYQMARRDYDIGKYLEANGALYPTREQWESAAVS
jgi:hypothetical protein